MRYYIDKNTLFIRGSFRAASTGISGGIHDISTILNHTVPPHWSSEKPEKELELVAAAAGLGRNYFGLLTAVPMQHLCVLQYDFINVFVTAGIQNQPDTNGNTINITVCSSEGMSDAALLETIMIAAEAKADALHSMDLPFTGTPTDAVIVACEGEIKHLYAGRLTDAGKRGRAAILYGVPEALRRHDGTVQRNRPSLFIFSRFGGDHWVEWTPDNCPYYPCHFEGQQCDYCYCPFYPCKDETLGQWVDSQNHGKVWNCARCTLLHTPEIAQYLKQYPDAPREELVHLRDKKKGNFYS